MTQSHVQTELRLLHELRARSAIVGLCILAAVSYGIVHDQITVRICVEYFTVAHPPVFPTTSPTLLGLGWGIIATWWVGALLGLGLTVAARSGNRPRLTARDLARPVLSLLIVMASGAMIGAVLGGALHVCGVLRLVPGLAAAIPPERQTQFFIAAGAHTASYAVGTIGGLVLILWVWRARSNRRVGGDPSQPH